MTAVVRALLQERPAAPPAARLLGAVAASSACFGAAIGAYSGGAQVLFAAVKMPFFLLSTLAITFGAMYVFAARELGLRQTFDAALETVAVTSVVLGALAPVAALASFSAPHAPGAYRFVILLLTSSVAAAGVAGVARLHLRLRSWRLTAVWVVLYQFVGAQVGWLLKPWVSCTYEGDRFLPLRENLKGNFYESVFRIVAGFFGAR